MGDDDALDCGFSSSPKHITRRLLSEPGFRLLADEYVDVDDESEEEEESNLEMGCPYCSEDFDALGLCVHLQDQHLIDTKSGICPLCATNLGMNMVSHLIIQHESTLKALRKRKLRVDQSYSIISLLRKKLQDQHLQSLCKESSSVVSSSNVTNDPLLLSFIYSPPQTHEPVVVQLNSSTEPSLSKKSSDERTLERAIEAHPLKHKDQEEKAQRCDFVHTLLFSTIFADNL